MVFARAMFLTVCVLGIETISGDQVQVAEYP